MIVKKCKLTVRLHSVALAAACVFTAAEARPALLGN